MSTNRPSRNPSRMPRLTHGTASHRPFSSQTAARAGLNFTHASGGVFRRDALPGRVIGKQVFALGKGHGMRGHDANFREGSSWATDEVMLNGKNGFGNNLQ